jgi:hypothetical protein
MLHGAEEAFRILQQLERLLRAGRAFLRKLPEPALPRRDQRDFCHGEHAVADKEDEDDEDFLHDGCCCAAATSGTQGLDKPWRRGMQYRSIRLSGGRSAKIKIRPEFPAGLIGDWNDWFQVQSDLPYTSTSM